MGGDAHLRRLEEWLTAFGPVTVAVSGGVDSTTLAVQAHRVLGTDARLVHARSSAVPREATERLRSYARSEGWAYEEVSAGEADDPRYVSNPIDRCFFCKDNLYVRLGGIGGQLVSGTNRDDLADFRPGLAAAQAHAVRHPFVELGMSKPAVRSAAAALGLDELVDLPASPCLASRVTTGIPVTPRRLAFVDQSERMARTELADLVSGRPEAALRVRLEPSETFLVLDPATLAGLAQPRRESLGTRLAALAAQYGMPQFAGIREYRRGEAFRHG